MQEQAAKEAEAAAAEALQLAKFEKGSAEWLDAKRLVDKAAANYAASKKVNYVV